MKNHLNILILLLLCISTYGQRGIELGALVQPQAYGIFSSAEVADKSVRIPYSFAIGANAGYNFTDNIGLRTGAMYSPQGEKYASGSSDFNLNLEYLQVPLYLKFNSNIEKTLSFLIFLGPHISYLNNATLTENEDDAISVLGDYSRFVPGASFSIGVQLNSSRGGNLNIVWRTGASFDNILLDDSFDSYNFSTGLQLAYHYFLTL